MPPVDDCYPQVVRALIKAGWEISPTPHAIPIPGRRNPLLADIRARRGDRQIIVIEVKCFRGDLLVELYIAIGQYLLYRSLLRRAGSNLPVYLAIPSFAYHGIFKEMAMELVSEVGMKLIVVDLEDEVIETWLE